MKALRQPGGLLHDVPGGIHEYKRDKDFLNVQHHATVGIMGESGVASLSPIAQWVNSDR